MAKQAQKQKTTSLVLDSLKWAAVVALLLIGVAANIHFQHIAWSLRMAVGIMLCLLMFALVVWTAQGHRGWLFLVSARQEMRKVVWPSRQETGQVTISVVMVILLVMLILWGVDSALMAVFNQYLPAGVAT